MNETIAFGLLCFTSFFTLINPIGVMPIFISLSSDLDHSARVRIVRKSTTISFIILIIFALSGQFLFKFFSISVDSFRIVGGIIFFIMGMDMLQARLAKIKIKDSEIKKYENDISITPMAIPMLAGPGAITNAIVLMEDATTTPMMAVLISSILVVLLITGIMLLTANKIIGIIGEVGNNVMMRLMGLIVMVIAVEFFFAGLKPILKDIFL